MHDLYRDLIIPPRPLLRLFPRKRCLFVLQRSISLVLSLEMCRFYMGSGYLFNGDIHFLCNRSVLLW